jgi:uncharacterized protein (TIGR03437 family)
MRSQFAGLLPLFAAACIAQTASVSPAISAVENNFSYTLPGLPNYGVAQGSIFVIFGANLANTSSGLQRAPLQATLDGVTVQVTAGGFSAPALLYYVSPNQIAGVLPSATPVGTGQIVVTNQGQPGAAAPITVVQSAFGIVPPPESPVTVTVFDAHFNALSPFNAANPGDMIVFYGTGAGPISTSDGVTPPVQNLTAIPIEVDIGGVPATVLYHGRSGSPGLDQMNVLVPQVVSGCHVSIVVNSSGLVSNTVFVPIAAQGRTCSDAVPGVVVPDPVTLTGSVITDGLIAITRLVEAPPTIITGAKSTTDDLASAVFYRNIASSPAGTIGVGLGVTSQFPSLGNCLVETSFSPTTNMPEPNLTNRPAKAAVGAVPTQTNLNAGPSINFSDPAAQGSVSLTPSGFYEGGLSNPPNPLFLPAYGGMVSINNGNGGPDVGAFAAQMSVAAPLTWSNMLELPSAISRSQGLTLTWTGGNPTGVATIMANSSANVENGYVSAYLVCSAPISAGQFTIPASALLALPAGPGAKSAIPPAMQLNSRDQSAVFAAPGLDGAIVYVSVNNNLSVQFQ